MAERTTRERTMWVNAALLEPLDERGRVQARHLLREWAGVEVVEGTLLCDGPNQDAIDAAVRGIVRGLLVLRDVAP